MNEQRSSTQPVVLLVDHIEERTYWIARLFGDAGYAVLRERSGAHARERAHVANPDLIFIAETLPDTTGIDLCATLSADARLWSGPPTLVVFARAPAREQRIAALRAGAWDCVAPPHDADELLLKTTAYVRAKRDLDQARAAGLLEPGTGLYNRQGLARRARELGSQAFREHGPLACLVLALDVPPQARTQDDDALASPLGRGVHALQGATRRSDVLGRLTSAEFAVLAPGTDAEGARRLAERLVTSLEAVLQDGSSELPAMPVRCGYDVVANVGYAPIEPVELLVRASTALRTGRPDERGAGRIRRFDPSGVSLS